MRKLSVLAMSLMIGGGLVAGAAPARAQDLECGPLIAPICSLVGRQVQHALEEVGHAYNTAYTYYDYADATVRCVVFKECS